MACVLAPFEIGCAHVTPFGPLASAGRKALKKIVGNTLVALTHRAPMAGVLSLATSVWSRLQIAVLR